MMTTTVYILRDMNELYEIQGCFASLEVAKSYAQSYDNDYRQGGEGVLPERLEWFPEDDGWKAEGAVTWRIEFSALVEK